MRSCVIAQLNMYFNSLFLAMSMIGVMPLNVSDDFGQANTNRTMMIPNNDARLM